MRQAAVIAALIGALALAAPSGAGAEVTQEDRDFAAAVRAYDAAALAVTHDPAILDAMRARRQAATACVDAARALGARQDGSSFVGAIFYTLHVTAPVFAALVPARDAYVHALRRMRLRSPVLRSARAVQLFGAGSVRAFAAIAADFCGPLQTWQSAPGDAIPAPIAAATEAFRRAPDVNDERTAKLRRASARLRAVGVRLATRERFVGVRSILDADAIFKGDQVLAAFDAAASGP